MSPFSVYVPGVPHCPHCDESLLRPREATPLCSSTSSGQTLCKSVSAPECQMESGVSAPGWRTLGFTVVVSIISAFYKYSIML